MFRGQHRRSVLASGILAAVIFAAPAAAQQRGAPMAPLGPTTDQAMSALAAAKAAAEALGVSLSCAVVDSRGDMIAMARMDGARFFTTDVAQGKARMSALFGQPSGAMADFGNSPAFSSFNETIPGPLYAFQGALPIMRDGELIGAMGCSGAASQVDEDAVRSALSVF